MMTRSSYSDRLRDAMEDLRPAFLDLGRGLEQLTRKRKDLAPTFYKAWMLWRRETRRPFVSFVQALDPSVPASRTGYRAHSSYQAAMDLLDLVRKPEETKRRGATPLAMLAVTIKSFLPLCGNQREQKEALEALMAATKWRDRDQRKLLTAIRRAKPVGLPKVPRLVDASRTTKAVVVAFERERLPA